MKAFFMKKEVLFISKISNSGDGCESTKETSAIEIFNADWKTDNRTYVQYEEGMV